MAGCGVNFRSLWRGLARRPPPAAAAVVAASTGNPILDWLDAAGLPWRATRSELAAHWGVRSDNPYRWAVVSLDVRPAPLAGLLAPFGFQAFAQFSPRMPPGVLSTHVSAGGNAGANIRFAAAQFARVLGPAAVVTQYNTRRADWQCGAASLTLMVWPPAMQSGPPLNIPAHRRDPRLAAACSVTLQTGWRPPLSPRERAWLDGFVAMGSTRPPGATPASPGAYVYAERHLEFTREPPGDLARMRGAFGLSAGGEALIFLEDALHVIALAQVTGFEVTRTLPAKGGGGSVLYARCDTGDAACPTKTVPVARGERADDLDDVAARLAEAAGKPLTLGDHDYDV